MNGYKDLTIGDAMAFAQHGVVFECDGDALVFTCVEEDNDE